MQTFEVKGKDGKVYDVRAENYERAYAVVNEDPAPGAEGIPWSEVPEDAARSAMAGVGKGVVALPGLPGDAASLQAPFNRVLGIDVTPERLAEMEKLGLISGKDTKGIKVKLPTSGELIEAASDATRPAPTLSQVVTGEKPQSFLEYKPKSKTGEAFETVGEFAPGFVIGPGGRMVRAATTFGAAGTSEGLGQLTKGTAYEPYARFGGAFLGSVAGHRMSYRPTDIDVIRQSAPADLTEYRSLGPEAMVLDASPSTVLLAQGLVGEPGMAKNDLVRALRDRDAGRSRRLLADVEGAMGPVQDIDLLKRSLAQSAQRRAGPMYATAKQNAPVLSETVDDLLARALDTPISALPQGKQQAWMPLLNDIDDALNVSRGGNPQLAAEKLHNIRKGLDEQIIYDREKLAMLPSAELTRQSVLKDARKTVDDLLKNRIPGFTEADEVVSQSKRLQDDLDFGRDSLEGGKYASTPEKFREDMRGRNRAYVGIGQRHDVRNAMGTQSNDLPALRKKVGGDADFNRDKISEIHGQGAVDQMAGGVRREETFSRNYADIDRNSQTAQRQEAAKVIRRNEPLEVSTGATVTGLGLKAGTAIVNALLRGANMVSRQPEREALVRALTTRGSAGEALLRAAQNAPSPTARVAAKALVNALLSTTEARTAGGPR